MNTKINWLPFEDGKTIGNKGSENGVILQDEEHIQGARITLEEDGYSPYGITCGIYGLMVLTNFNSTKLEANANYNAMKAEIELFFDYFELNTLSEEESETYMYIWLEQFRDSFGF